MMMMMIVQFKDDELRMFLGGANGHRNRRLFLGGGVVGRNTILSLSLRPESTP